MKDEKKVPKLSLSHEPGAADSTGHGGGVANGASGRLRRNGWLLRDVVILTEWIAAPDRFHACGQEDLRQPVWRGICIIDREAGLAVESQAA
jgi:hypothetical protein